MEVTPGKPILIDKFLESAIEVDVDSLSDGRRTLIGGVMQHIEEAGVHSGDSACVIPPHSLPREVVEEIRRQTRAMAQELNVKGLMNVQFAVGRDGTVYVLEVNPRASRTVPFVSKATGVPLARYAALVMVGKTLDELGLFDEVVPKHFSVKESVFPFNKFLGVDIILGPEMRSTGEVMGIDDNFPMAFAKSQMAANSPLPRRARCSSRWPDATRRKSCRSPGRWSRWAIRSSRPRHGPGAARGGHRGRRHQQASGGPAEPARFDEE